MKIYYARPMNIYGKPIDIANKALLQKLGFEVIDPDKKELVEKYAVQGMSAFYEVIDTCDALTYFTTGEGSITSGVMKEIYHAQSQNKPVFEIPNFLGKKILTVEETRQYLSSVGFR